ncbi:MAG: hypothetical protein A2452_11985 [Candidatus Firestonebacteria bacterium RIFOXYC2_FULL_39_67]|nr:MAG: hypothetical protein A2536_00350 [Candidatus Firestonebacteria bacterium RIFOXYD2_FULL_39_29]OGF55686.1 MAG: hypothetical protein A2452_11985 [Candidatus Firestonebacteria bacterium RIFOXYC2_FULL_39_67]OGF57906.1 MAG: hypothetical protein A2497_04320 [Candidatus Firestonebacteria bacterium RifOxyC12_full_39_7]
MILIVDDEQNICNILARFLKKEGYETEIAKIGLDAVTIFKEKKPSLVLLDINLPDIDGIEVLRKIKEIDKGVPVIMITACMDSERVALTFRLGACDCIYKPFDFDYLKVTIKSLLGNRR